MLKQHIFMLCHQEIQLQLKESEQTDKSDDSPVTIADYGELAQLQVL